MLDGSRAGLEVVEDCLVWVVRVGYLASARSEVLRAYLFHELATADDCKWGSIDPVGKCVGDRKFQLPGTSFPQAIDTWRPYSRSDMRCWREEHMWDLPISYQFAPWSQW